MGAQDKGAHEGRPYTRPILPILPIDVDATVTRAACANVRLCRIMVERDR